MRLCPKGKSISSQWSFSGQLSWNCREIGAHFFSLPPGLSRPGFIPEKSLEELELTFSETSFWPGNKPSFSLSDEHEKAC